MKRNKGNINLAAAGELKQSGLWLSLRKGMGELLRPRRIVRHTRPLPRDTGDLPLSVILCTAGTCPGLERAIETVLNQTLDAAHYEVLVVWNRPDAPPSAAYSPRVRWIQEPTPGLSYARNAGANAAKGRVLFYMDDDAVAASSLTSILWKTAKAHPKAAIIGGQIHLALPSPRPKIVLSGKEGLWSAYEVSYKRYRRVREQYAFPYGACFAIRHSALEALGGFPTTYGRVGDNFAGGEETALCFRSLHYGWEIGIQPSMEITHHVEPRRFTLEHVRQTIMAGIVTTYRLSQEGYALRGWDARYIRDRAALAERELTRLRHTGTPLEQYYKECERDAFVYLFKEELC